MNLPDILHFTRQLLRVGATDPRLTDADVTQAVNLARAAIWSELSGNDAQTLTLDLVANQSTYSLEPWTPERVLSVAVVDAVGYVARRLDYTSTRTLLERYPWYPRTDGYVLVQGYQLRPWACVAPVADIWTDPMAVGSLAAVRGYVIELWPAPTQSIAGGLSIQLIGQSAPLSTTYKTSALPDCVDVAACYRAAVRLAPVLGRDPVVMQWLPVLRSDADEELKRARRHISDLNAGPMLRLYPRGFGGTQGRKWSEPSAPIGITTLATPTPVSAPTETTGVVGPLWTHIDEAATVGTSVLTVDLDAHRVARVNGNHLTEVRAVSQDQGEIFNVTANGIGSTITATLGTNPDTGLPFTFSAGELVRFFYPSA